MPESKARVAIELYVDDKGTLRVKQFSQDSQEAFRKTETAGTGAADRVKAAWASAKAAFLGVIAAIMAVREAWNMANMAAQARQEKQAFASLAASYGTNSKKILASLKEVSGGTVDTMTLIRSAGTAMMMGIAPDDVIKLMEVARATAKMTGQSTVKAFEDVTLAVGRQSKMILDNLGIILDVEKANEAYAKSIGKTVGQLNDLDRKQAFMNATLKAGKELTEKLGNQNDTAADKFERFTATIQNMKVAIGDGLIRVFYFLEGGFTAVAAGALALSGGIFKIIGGVGWLTDKLHLTSGAAAKWKLNSEAAFGAAGDLVDKANQSYKDMKSSNDAIIQGQTEFQNQLRKTTEAMEEQEKKRKQILDQHKKEADAQAEAERQMYEEAGIGAEKYYNQQATALLEKAAKWQKAGGDVLAIETWLEDELGKLSQKAWEDGESIAGMAMDNLQVLGLTTVNEMISATTTGLEWLKTMGIEIQGLDGSHIGITASMDGSGVISEIDTIIAKMRQLQGASSAATATAASAQGGTPYQNTDSTKSAQEVYEAGLKHDAGNKTTININQQLSRSDVTAIVSEQKRREARA
jgi:hypothetical protein